MPRMPTVEILGPGMIAVVWTPQVRPSNKVNFQITNVERLYWCPLIIIFQMLRQQINQTLRRNPLLVRSLRVISSQAELRNTGREISMAAPVVRLVLRCQVSAWPTLTCKYFLRKDKMESSTVAPTCNLLTTQSLMLYKARRRRAVTNHWEAAKLRLRTLLCFNNEAILYNLL